MPHFSARLGRWQLRYTVILLAAVGGIAVITLASGRPDISKWLAIVLGFLLLVGLFSVRGYDLDAGRLVIRRPAWRTKVDLFDLEAASTEPKLVNASISLWSTRGLYGCIGYWLNEDMGVYHAYVTDPATAVLLQFRSGRKIVVSPESPEDFISELGLKGSDATEMDAIS